MDSRFEYIGTSERFIRHPFFVLHRVLLYGIFSISKRSYFRLSPSSLFIAWAMVDVVGAKEARKPNQWRVNVLQTPPLTSPLNNEFAFDSTFKLPRILCLAKQAAQQRSQHVDSFLIKIRCFIDFIFNPLRSFLLPVRAPATRKEHNQHHR